MEDHQLLLTYLLLASSHQSGPLALAFLDLQKTYDWLPRVTLWHILAAELEVPEPIRTVIEALYFQTRSVVWAGGFMSTAFDVNMGVKQGCPASPHVFFQFLDGVWDFIAAHIPSSQCVHTPFLALLATLILLYADDLVLIADSLERLQ